MDGKEVKKLIYASGFKLWQVAYEWGMCDSNFSRKLRKPLTDEEVVRLKKIIKDLTDKRERMLNQ